MSDRKEWAFIGLALVAFCSFTFFDVSRGELQIEACAEATHAHFNTRHTPARVIGFFGEVSCPPSRLRSRIAFFENDPEHRKFQARRAELEARLKQAQEEVRAAECTELYGYGRVERASLLPSVVR